MIHATPQRPQEPCGKYLWCHSLGWPITDAGPEEAHMPLLDVPYAVSRNEGFILSNRRILADQMAFLQAMLPRYSRWAG